VKSLLKIEKDAAANYLFVSLKKKLSMYTDSVPPYIDTVILYKRKLLTTCHLGVARFSFRRGKISHLGVATTLAIPVAIAVATTDF